MKESPILKIALYFSIWRLILFAAAFYSPQIIPNFGATFPYFQERLIATNLPHFIWAFGNFDGVHYIGIAKDLYAYQFTQAFFPLYPLLMRLLDLITNNSLISGLLISNLSFLAGLIIFYKLVKLKFNDSVANWATIFALTFPTSFYMGAVYTEGLFFLLTVSAFYLLEKNKIVAASILGAFSSATRLIGLFVGLALAFRQKTRGALLAVSISSIGFLAYVLYLKLEFNNPLYFLTSQAIFGQARETTRIILLPQVIWRYIKILSTTQGTVFANALFELVSTIFAFAILLIALKMKIKPQWLIFSFLAIITPTLTGTLASMPRYILLAFPIYIVLGKLENKNAKIAIALTFSILLIASTMVFAQGYWVA